MKLDVVKVYAFLCKLIFDNKSQLIDTAVNP